MLQAIPLRVKSDKLPLIDQRQVFIETKTKRNGPREANIAARISG